MESNWLELFNENKPKVKQSCCSNMDLKIIDGYQCCTNCGSLDSDNPHLVYNTYNDHSTYKCSMPYFRVVYFKQKLNMINNVLLYKLNPKIIYFIEKNKNKKIKNIKKDNEESRTQ